MSDFKENIEKLNIRGIIMSSVMTAFGLVVALSWKDAINELVNSIIPNSDSQGSDKHTQKRTVVTIWDYRIYKLINCIFPTKSNN